MGRLRPKARDGQSYKSHESRVSLFDLMRFSAGALRGHRLRTALSVVGVAIGIASVMVLTSLGEGARAYVTSQFEALGSNLLIVVPGRTETEGEAPLISQAPHDLTVEDMEAVLRRCPRVRAAAPILLGTAVTSYGEKRREVTVFGTTAAMQAIRGMEVRIGRFLPDEEMDRSARVCVIGPKIQHELFGDTNPLGEVLKVGEERFKVIGALAPRGVSLGFDLDEVVEIPVKAAMALFDRASLFRILCQIRSKDELALAEAEVRQILKERHDDTDDVTLIRQDSMIQAFGKILNVLTAALAAIAAISLGVAGIGIMNVMLVSVSERTSEIGLLKAIGAPPREIERVFLVESVLLAIAGGAVGLALGYTGAAILGQAYPELPAEPPLWAVGGAIAVSFAAGIAFGVLPARRAARLDPVAALARH